MSNPLDPAATLYLLVPAALKQRLEEKATAENQSTNAYALHCFEQCLGLQAAVRDLIRAWHSLSAMTIIPEKFNKRGCLEIAQYAQAEVEIAFKRLGMDIEKEHPNAGLVPGIDVPDWEGREHDDLKEEEWRSS